MSASRWHTGPLDVFDWLQDSDTSLEDLFLPSIFTRLQKKDEQDKSLVQPASVDGETIKYPEIIPILPLRGVVVYPQTAVPLTIGQPRSIKLVDEVSTTTEKLVGLVAARNPEIEEPGAADLYAVGTIATVHRLFRAPDNTIRLLVQGLMRFRVVEVVETEPFLKARIDVLPELVETGLEIEALARSARDQFEQISGLTPSIPRELVASIVSLEDPLQTVYTIANFQRIELKDAQTLLELDSTKAKLEKLVDLLVREAEVLSLGAKIQNRARSEIEKVQREYYLREQMKAIQKELGENDEQAVEVEE
ncbi:MAG: LON peptidase substrate-binding domain-containing protein, partial [Chloroflexi bacterium]|nr:LON peptidase substrate-binding domain-containing protein [Chloroflexota bacterium]